MTDRLNIVTIRIKHEGPIVVRMVLWAQPWCPIVTPTRGQGRVVKGIDQGAAAHLKRNMQWRFIRGALANPEVRFLRFAKARHIRVPRHCSREFHEERVSQRGQRPGVKLLTLAEVPYYYTSMVNHGFLLKA